LGFLDTSGARNISVSDATEIIATYRTMYFDYLRGRVMKVDISGDDLDTALYNRDNGAGAAERALDHLAQESRPARAAKRVVEVTCYCCRKKWKTDQLDVRKCPRCRDLGHDTSCYEARF
jgi:hypothetical protein